MKAIQGDDPARSAFGSVMPMSMIIHLSIFNISYRLSKKLLNLSQ
jgi:hypothetical protein